MFTSIKRFLGFGEDPPTSIVPSATLEPKRSVTVISEDYVVDHKGRKVPARDTRQFHAWLTAMKYGRIEMARDAHSRIESRTLREFANALPGGTIETLQKLNVFDLQSYLDGMLRCDGSSVGPGEIIGMKPWVVYGVRG
jgi:hypothetical protein